MIHAVGGFEAIQFFFIYERRNLQKIDGITKKALKKSQNFW